jgi:hypothetical protein
MDEIRQIRDAMIEGGKCFYQGLQALYTSSLRSVARKWDRLPVPPSQLLPGLVAAKLKELSK